MTTKVDGWKFGDGASAMCGASDIIVENGSLIMHPEGDMATSYPINVIAELLRRAGYVVTPAIETYEGALTEARKRWGDRARIWHDNDQHQVGIQGAVCLESWGNGDTWQAAFVNSDECGDDAEIPMPRTAEDERADVVAWFATMPIFVADVFAQQFESGAHVGAAKRGG